MLCSLYVPIDLRALQKHFISLLPVMEADLFLMGIDGKLIRNLSFVLLNAPTLLLLRAPINFPRSYMCASPGIFLSDAASLQNAQGLVCFFPFH